MPYADGARACRLPITGGTLPATSGAMDGLNPRHRRTLIALAFCVSAALARAQVAPPPAPPITTGAAFSIATPESPAAQLYSIGDPTNEEQYYLELINRARANPTAEGLRLATDDGFQRSLRLQRLRGEPRADAGAVRSYPAGAAALDERDADHGGTGPQPEHAPEQLPGTQRAGRFADHASRRLHRGRERLVDRRKCLCVFEVRLVRARRLSKWIGAAAPRAAECNRRRGTGKIFTAPRFAKWESESSLAATAGAAVSVRSWSRRISGGSAGCRRS